MNRKERKRLDRLKREAAGGGRSRKKSGGPPRDIVPGGHGAFRQLFMKHKIGASRLRRTKVDPSEVRALCGADETRQMKTISADFATRLEEAFPEEARLEVRATVEEWTFSRAERFCLERAQHFRRERIRELEPNAPDIPMFDARGALQFVKPSDPDWVASRQTQFEKLLRRVRAVLPEHCILATADDLEGSSLIIVQRILAPLLEWESSGFTQRHWRELSAVELHRYLAPETQFEAHSVLISDEAPLKRIRRAIKQGGPNQTPFNPAHAVDRRTIINPAFLDSAFGPLDEFADSLQESVEELAPSDDSEAADGAAPARAPFDPDTPHKFAVRRLARCEKAASEETENDESDLRAEMAGFDVGPEPYYDRLGVNADARTAAADARAKVKANALLGGATEAHLGRR